jgi:hypothetical protein
MLPFFLFDLFDFAVKKFRKECAMKRSVKKAPGAKFWFALTLLLLVGSCEQPAGTGGTARVTLRTAADLAKIGVDPAYPLDGNYALGADLTLTDWTSIGTYDAPFTGTFDGGGRTLAISGSGGIFGFTDGALISNVTVSGTISANRDGTVQAGGIVGNATNTEISFCVSQADIVVEGNGYNTSAGGIAGYLRDNSTVSDCYATGNITLRCGDMIGLSHAGGIAGYQGTGLAAEGSSGCVISRCWFSGNISAEGNFPYAGGIVGYNYCGSIIRECYSANGTVAATGSILPYAGGISGYNSMTVADPSVIENCYSSMTVSAVSSSKAALAGGISGANAASAVVSKCYALGTVAATVDGNGPSNLYGSMGVSLSANAGGIAGDQYFNAPSIERCVALNAEVKGTDSGSGAAYNVRRIAGPGTGEHNGAWKNNIASVATLAAGSNTVAPQSNANGYDGETCPPKPTQAAYTALGWDFATVWTIGNDGYPVLRAISK